MFVILPVGMNYRTERLPIVTLSLIGGNVLIYLVSLVAMFKTGGESDSWIFEHLWLIPAESLWWTYLTSTFVHGGFFHLLGNMIYLFLFGCCVEDLIGRWRFLGLYLISGVVSNLAFIAFSVDHFDSVIPLGGASGAISACMGMYLLLRANADIEFRYFFFFLPIIFRTGEFEVPAWIAICFWFAMDLFWMIIGMVYHHEGGGTAFGAHVGGFLGGLALIAICKKFLSAAAPPEEYAVCEPVRVAAPVKNVARAPIRIRMPGAAAAPEPAPAAMPEAVSTPAEAPTIYLHEGGQQSGPFTLTQIQDRLRAGTIQPDAFYWCEGLTEWQNVTDLAG